MPIIRDLSEFDMMERYGNGVEHCIAAFQSILPVPFLVLVFAELHF